MVHARKEAGKGNPAPGLSPPVRLLRADAREAIRQNPVPWGQWLEMCQALEDPDYELTVEDFADLLATFNKLIRLGFPFTPHLHRTMRDFECNAAHSQEDGDSDGADERIDWDDSDDDFDGDIGQVASREDRDAAWWHQFRLTQESYARHRPDAELYAGQLAASWEVA